MNFFKRLKAQHIALLITQPSKRFNWQLFGLFAGVMIVSGAVLYGLFGEEILAEVSRMFMEESGNELPIPLGDAKWLLIGVPFVDILFEFIWMSVVAFITMRVLVYLKTPLSFKQLFNVYLLTRVYEMLVGLALLLGFAVVALYTGTETIPFLQEEPSTAGVVTSFIIPVYFFWVYLWSVRFVTKQMAAIEPKDKPEETNSNV